MSEFECLSTRIVGLRPSNLLNCFLSGLGDGIQHELYILKFQTLPNGIGITNLIEDKCNAARFSPGPPCLPLRPIPTANIMGTPNGPPWPPPTSHPFPIKKLTPIEMAARQEQGLCFNYDSRFTRGHRCNPLQVLCLLVDDEEEFHGEVLKPDPP